MLEKTNQDPIEFCPECEDGLVEPKVPGRRSFIKVVGGHAAALVAAGTVGATAGVLRSEEKSTKKSQRPKKPAEDLICELHSELTDAQKKQIVLPWNHGSNNGKQTPTRQKMFNRPINGQLIGKVFTKPQQELNQRILRAILADDKAFATISRHGEWDSSGSFEGCGATIFGDPTDGKEFAWVFSGHHLTLRCDGNSEPGAAFGGPMYYGHSYEGYDPDNAYFYQTKSVLKVFKSLNKKQRELAIAKGSPGEQAKSVTFRAKGQATPGIAFADLNAEQQELVQHSMKTILNLYRKEDADEVMQIIKKTGGMDDMHLAFYPDKDQKGDSPWRFWRLEGPGFVWNYRVLPHVHCFVNISSKIT